MVYQESTRAPSNRNNTSANKGGTKNKNDKKNKNENTNPKRKTKGDGGNKSSFSGGSTDGELQNKVITGETRGWFSLRN